MGTKARSLSEAFTNDAFVLKDVSGYSGVDRIYFSDECCRGRKRFSGAFKNLRGSHRKKKKKTLYT